MDKHIDTWIHKMDIVPQHVTDFGLSPPPPLLDLPMRESVEAMLKTQPDRNLLSKFIPKAL